MSWRGTFCGAFHEERNPKVVIGGPADCFHSTPVAMTSHKCHGEGGRESNYVALPEHLPPVAILLEIASLHSTPVAMMSHKCHGEGGRESNYVAL